MNKLHVLLLGAVMLCSHPAWADDGDYDLYLKSLDGAYTRLDIANLRSLSFSQEYVDKVWQNTMWVNGINGTSVSYDLNSADCILFAPLATSIDDVTTASSDGIEVKLTSSTLSLSLTGSLSVFGIDGRLVKTVDVEAGTPISVSDLAKGTYVLKINGQTAKIMIR